MPKLALRDLFAVVTIVALALGWWLDRSRLARERDTAQVMWNEMAESATFWIKKYEDATVQARSDPFADDPFGPSANSRDQPSHSN